MSDTIVPVEKFGRDHWSMLAYFELVCVDCAGFQVGNDPRMRQFERSFFEFRLSLRCPDPQRPSKPCVGPMDGAKDVETKYGTRLNDDTQVNGHDDWNCVVDFMHAGFLTTKDYYDIDGGEMLHLSLLGTEMVNQLRYHKSNGGTYANFRPKFLERPLGNVA